MQPELWRAGLAGRPVGDFLSAYEDASPFIRSVNRSQFGPDAEGRLMRLRRTSPLTYVRGVRAPILIIGGRYDLLCPPRQNERYRDALRERGVDCEFYLYEGGHGYASGEESAKEMVRMITFLARATAMAEGEMIETGER